MRNALENCSHFIYSLMFSFLENCCILNEPILHIYAWHVITTRKLTSFCILLQNIVLKLPISSRKLDDNKSKKSPNHKLNIWYSASSVNLKIHLFGRHLCTLFYWYWERLVGLSYEKDSCNQIRTTRVFA